MEKTAIKRISRNLDTNVQLKVNDTMLKEMDKFIYLGSEIQNRKSLERSVEKYDIVLNSIKL
jgi:hypothetical protein